MRGDTSLSGTFVYAAKLSRLGGLTNNDIMFVEPGTLSNEPKATTVAIPNEIRKTKSGFEDVLRIEDDTYLIGNTEGYIVVSLNQLDQSSNEIRLSEASYSSLHNDLVPIDISQSLSLENKNNRIQFRYSVPNFDKLSISKYQ
jgi:hypothetical protein